MNSKELMEQAFKEARKKASQIGKVKDNSKKPLVLEHQRIFVTADIVVKALIKVMNAFPNPFELTEFEKALLNCSIPIQETLTAKNHLKKSIEIIQRMGKESRYDVSKAHGALAALLLRKKFYGRLKSVLSRTDDSLELLIKGAKAFRELPKIDREMETLIIAGYPNVGKSTLLKRLTGSAPKIAAYPFTTQDLNIGFLPKRFEKIQVIDTPGLLDRPLAERNPIERKAIHALHYLGNFVLFVMDFSITAKQDVEKQFELLEEIKENAHKPIIVLINKIDLLSEKELAAARKFLKEKNIDNALESGNEKDEKELREKLLKALKESSAKS